MRTEDNPEWIKEFAYANKVLLRPDTSNAEHIIEFIKQIYLHVKASFPLLDEEDLFQMLLRVYKCRVSKIDEIERQFCLLGKRRGRLEKKLRLQEKMRSRQEKDLKEEAKITKLKDDESLLLSPTQKPTQMQIMETSEEDDAVHKEMSEEQ